MFQTSWNRDCKPDIESVLKMGIGVQDHWHAACLDTIADYYHAAGLVRVQLARL